MAPLVLAVLLVQAMGARVDHDGGEDAERELGVRQSGDVAQKIAAKFTAGSLMVHMKRDMSNVTRGFDRWRRNGHMDDSLSYSMIDPSMALEKLWVKVGFLIDGSKCLPLAGSATDLWVNNEVQHGAQMILTTPEGRRAELLRLLYIRHIGRATGSPVHVVLPLGFIEWARNPDGWSPYEREVFTWPSPFFPGEWTVREVPSADDLGALVSSLERGADSTLKVEPDLASIVSGVRAEYNMVGGGMSLRTKFTEILAQCPLDALRGFIYSMQDVPPESAEEWRSAQLQQGRGVLKYMRESIFQPGGPLAAQDLVIAEYSPRSEGDVEHGATEKSIADVMASAKAGGGPVVVEWKQEFQAKLRVVEVCKGKA